MAEVETLRVQKLADKSGEERVVRFNPLTGEKLLVNPASSDPNDLSSASGWQHEPWPLAGVKIADPPQHCRVSTSYIALGRSEGWIVVEGEQVVHRPGGPAENKWAITHTFVQCDAIVFKTVDGDIRYRVVHHPDKYVDSDDPTETVTDEVYANGDTRIDWFYSLQLENSVQAPEQVQVGQ